MFLSAFLSTLLYMTLTASVAIGMVFLARMLLDKSPKIISYALWGVVLFRLLCPVSFASNLSLFGWAGIPTHYQSPGVSSMVYQTTEYTWPDESLSWNGQAAAPPALDQTTVIVSGIWLAGLIAMGVYAAVSYRRLRRKLVTASLVRDNIYLSDEIPTPFVLGLFHPKIYLPSSLSQEEQDYVLLHEQHHIKRRDPLFKGLAFLALAVHWFNPVVWAAFVAASKDMEMSCDEAVARNLEKENIADYAACLLCLTAGASMGTRLPLAFGEGDTKQRVRNLARWTKPALKGVILTVVLCALLGVSLFTNPNTAVDPEVTDILRETLTEERYARAGVSFCDVVDCKILGQETRGKETTLYFLLANRRYRMGQELESVGGGYGPAAMTVEKGEDGYHLTEFWTPMDGDLRDSGVLNKFPAYLWLKAVDSRYAWFQDERIERRAQQYFETPEPDSLLFNE